VNAPTPEQVKEALRLKYKSLNLDRAATIKACSALNQESLILMLDEIERESKTNGHSTEKEVTQAETTAKFDEYRSYISAIFRPRDTLCFAGINHKKDVRDHDFIPYEKAITREYFEHLQEANKDGSIYLAMNTYPASLIGEHKGRTQENVVDVRALQADIDYNGTETMDAIKSSASVPQPSIVVESSPGKFQGIWLVDGISKADAKPLMQAIASEFKTDAAVAEVARVMRAPGFVNRKYDSAPVARIVSQTNARYSRTDFKLRVSAPTEFKEKNPDGWVKDIQLQHGNIYNQLVKLAGYYVREHNADDPDVLYTLLAKHCETAIDRDGVTPFQCNMGQVRQLTEKWADEFETGEEYKARTSLTLNIPVPQAQAQAQAQTQTQTAEPQAWGEVLPLKSVLRPVLPFSPEYLPQAIRPWCKDVSERMGVPLDFAGIAALETIAGVIGRRAFVYPKARDKEWKESIAISGGVVSSSGTKKTPAWKLFTNVVVELEMDLKKEHEQKVKQFETTVAKIEQARKAAERRGSIPSSETIALANQEPPPDPGKPPRLVLNDVTPEKAHITMSENAYGLLYYRDELASWAAELDKKGRESQRGMFLAAMNGNDYYALDRIERGENFAIMCLSVCGNFQPEILRIFLSDARNTADGMVPRFQLLVWPDETQVVPPDRGADAGAKGKFRQVIRTLAAIKTEAIDMHFNEEAQKLRDQWDKDLGAKIREERHSGKKAHLSKYGGGLPKVAALFQLVDLVERGGALAGGFQIDAEHTQMAINFFRYLESHMSRVYDSAFEPVQVAEADIAHRILAGDMQDMMSVRDIQRKCWQGLKGLTADQISLALENLADRGYVRPVWSQPGPGRPVIRWGVNPAANRGF